MASINIHLNIHLNIARRLNRKKRSPLPNFFNFSNSRHPWCPISRCFSHGLQEGDRRQRFPEALRIVVEDFHGLRDGHQLLSTCLDLKDYVANIKRDQCLPKMEVPIET